MRYPNVPGHNNVHTSIEAAKEMVEKAAAIRVRLHRLLLDGHELTSEEASIKLGIKYDNGWKRMSELRANGHAEDSGIKRPNKSSGKNAIVWKLRTEEGTDIDYHNSTKANLLATIDHLQGEVDRLTQEKELLLQTIGDDPIQPQQIQFDWETRRG
jgi:hypothetical protein